MRPTTVAGSLVLGLALFLLPGCLVGHKSSDVTTGTFVGRETLAQIKPGETRADFVAATLGQPSSKETLSDGSELWKYRYTRSRRSGGYVFVLIAAGSREDTAATTYVQFRDGVVQKCWQDTTVAHGDDCD